MSKAQGSPLSGRIWQAHCHATPNTSIKRSRYLTTEEKEKVMKQLGTISSQLSYLRLAKIGSLFEEEEEDHFSVKECLSPGHLLHQRDTIREIHRGPFDQEQDYYKSLLSIFRLHIQNLSMEHHVFFAPVPLPQEYSSYASYLSATDRWNDFVTIGSKVDSGRNRLHYFIASQFLEGMIPHLSQCESQNNGFEHGFPIRHFDLSTNNIFVDDDCNITCVIDWAFASSVPVNELFITPGLPHPRDRLEPSLVAAFRGGFENHVMNNGKMIHHSVWESADKVWLFSRLINMDALQDYNHFTEFCASVFGQQTTDVFVIFREQFRNEAVSIMAKILSEEDQSQNEIKRHEDAYFSAVGIERRALSMKLTIASELNKNFVADDKLWRWIERYLDS